MALGVISAKKKTNRGVSRKPDVLPGQLLFMNSTDFRTHPTFENLLRIEDGLLERTTEDMRANGFYRSKPITLAVWDGQDEPVIADGHMRRQASINAGITSVPYVLETFSDEMAVVQYAISCQTEHRRTTDGAFYRLCGEFDRLMERGRPRKGEEPEELTPCVINFSGPSASARMTASLIGCHYRKVDKIRKIRKDGWPEIQEAVRNDDMTINKAYKLIRDEELGKDESEKKPSAARTKAAKTLLSEEHFESLKALGGDLPSHLDTAVEQYIFGLRDKERSQILRPD